MGEVDEHGGVQVGAVARWHGGDVLLDGRVAALGHRHLEIEIHGKPISSDSGSNAPVFEAPL